MADSLPATLGHCLFSAHHRTGYDGGVGQQFLYGIYKDIVSSSSFALDRGKFHLRVFCQDSHAMNLHM